MIVRSRAPLRIGLSGGGTDVDPYCADYGAFIVNVTINRYAHCTIDDSVNYTNFVATDLDVEDHKGDVLVLHNATLDFVIDRFGVERKPLKISTYVDAPQGSGLGSSSSLVVAMLTGLLSYYNIHLLPYDIAQYSWHIERVLCKFDGGWQDQYAAAFGGFNTMVYENGHYAVMPIELTDASTNELEESFKLVYTNTSRESANIIKDHADSVSNNNTSVIDAINNVKAAAQLFKTHVANGNYRGMVASMQLAWDAKKAMSSKISNPMIDRVVNTGIEHGGLAAKISGAGGGGFIFFMVDPEYAKVFENKMAEEGYHVNSVKFEKQGARAWKV